MSHMNVPRAAALVMALALLPQAAAAQSAIAGLVKDNTGAVLPGATVEAASPALIEGRRSVVTDGEGRFSIINLRPGLYNVTFALEGFSRVERQGIELPSNFTATVDATLNVGSVSETVTVTGESPIVDVQQAQRTQVLSSQLLESIVNSGSVWTQAMLVAGVRMTGADVGGTQYSTDLQLEAHGASSLHNTYTLEGLSVDNASSDGSDNSNYWTQVANQEVVIETSGGSAEYSVGGVRMNMIPKDGGNTFHGTGYAGESSGAWQSDNFTDRVKNAGVTTIDLVDRIWDYSATVGGPIMKDKMWFHFSYRNWGNSLPTTDSFYDDGRQYSSTGYIEGLVPRITWQVTPRNKIAMHLERQGKNTGPHLECCAKYPAVLLPSQKGNDPETATTYRAKDRPYGAHYIKWSSPINSKLLFEAGHSTSFLINGARYNPGIKADPFTPEWYGHVRKTDIDRSLSWDAPAPLNMSTQINHEYGFAASYVTGSHTLKMGIQRKDAKDGRDTQANGDINTINYRSGVPDSVVVGNYPIVLDPRLNYDIGVFGQDRWAFKRFTLSPGVRVEWLNEGVREQHAPGGRFVPERIFPEVKNVPAWGPDVSPRFGLAYDLFGNARTALKFSVGKYLTRNMTTLAARSNPLAVITQSLPWSDRDLKGRSLATNGDNIVQDSELDLTRLPSNFGVRQIDRLDPDLKREYNVETALTMQHTLMRNISLSAGWYHRAFHNSYVDDNVLRSFADYRPIEVVSPYNGEIFTAYDLTSASKLSQVDTLVTNGDRKTVYNGFELALEARLPGGGTILANSTIQRSLTDSCDQRDDPNLLRFCDRFNLPDAYPVRFRSDFKLAASHSLPYRVQLSANLTSQPGRQEGNLLLVDELLPISWNISRTTRYTQEGCAGRPCTPGALVIPNMVQTSLVLPLAPAGTARFLERQNQLNIGVKKIFRVRGIQYSAELDIYNMLNADTIMDERSANFGTATYALPSRILQGRLPRLAMRMNW